ncbi:hypothetical protein ACGFY9_47190 [Streptomyces sp. NPDC048504]|uniref:hypothetical protein n=1 Tax=Streptomyces sp. NPDC048504 TaxID=3365559 RepID=UPI00371FC2CE
MPYRLNDLLELTVNSSTQVRKLAAHEGLVVPRLGLRHHPADPHPKCPAPVAAEPRPDLLLALAHAAVSAAGRLVLKPDLVHHLPSPDGGVLRQVVGLDATFKTRSQRDDLDQMTACCVLLGLAWAISCTARVDPASWKCR